LILALGVAVAAARLDEGLDQGEAVREDVGVDVPDVHVAGLDPHVDVGVDVRLGDHLGDREEQGIEDLILNRLAEHLARGELEGELGLEVGDGQKVLHVCFLFSIVCLIDSLVAWSILAI